ncbi:hypothetical protein DIPPA_28283 [Diplonema papillatum]|nr:hypothetical protein DIPPA_28283 [Diplonema papillatum]
MDLGPRYRDVSPIRRRAEEEQLAEVLYHASRGLTSLSRSATPIYPFAPLSSPPPPPPPFPILPAVRPQYISVPRHPPVIAQCPPLNLAPPPPPPPPAPLPTIIHEHHPPMPTIIHERHPPIQVPVPRAPPRYTTVADNSAPQPVQQQPAAAQHVSSPGGELSPGARKRRNYWREFVREWEKGASEYLIHSGEEDEKSQRRGR